MAQATLTQAQSAPRPGEKSGLWLLKLVTGPFILILIAVHLIVNHLIGSASGLLSYTEVINYYQIWVVPVMEGLFLALVVTHSLLGLRSIILDLRPSSSLMRALDYIFIVVGVVAFVYGIWLIRAIVSSGV